MPGAAQLAQARRESRRYTMRALATTSSSGQAEEGGREMAESTSPAARAAVSLSVGVRGRQLRQLIRRYWQALQRERIPLLAALSAGLLVAGAAAVYVAEQGGPAPVITSFEEALWYAIVTMATVGYGDFTPKTTGGRALAALIILGGMTLLSVITATLASILVEQKIKEGRGLEAVRARNHVLVCGWSQYAERVLEGLLQAANRAPAVVLVNELSEEAASEVLTRYRAQGVSWVRGDPAVEGTLDRANVREAQAAVVLADTSRAYGSVSDERTTLVTLALKSMKPDLKVTAEALDLKSDAHLRRAGADEIVISGEFNGFLLSSAAVAPGVSEVVRQMLSLNGAELRRLTIPSDLVGRSFGEVFQALRARDGFLALAIVTEHPGLTLDDLLTDDYSLVDNFIKNQFRDAGAEYLRFEESATRVLVNPPDTYVISPEDTAIGIPRGA